MYLVSKIFKFFEINQGDTLGLIAAKFNTAVEILMALNPSITDPKLIYVGQTIFY